MNCLYATNTTGAQAMTNEELLTKIHEAAASKATTLDLSGKGLAALPPEIGQLTNLTWLILGDNQLLELPSEIGQLAELEKIELWNNKLTSLPPEMSQLSNLRELNLSGNKFNSLLLGISQLVNLTYLDLSWNQITELPSAIGQLIKLTGLDFWGNELTELPIEIDQLAALRYLNLGHNQFRTLPPELFRLTGLTELNLSRNELSELPSGFFQMTKLTRLDLNDNKLIALPPEIGQLTSLEILNLWDNQLSSLPSEIGRLKKLKELPLYNNQLTSLPSSIGQLINLKALELSRNQLASLPPELFRLTKLRTLNLYRNKLTTLPKEICKLTNLTKLYVNGNKLTDPPLEIARKGIEVIDEYFVALEKGAQPLNEVKLILVGDGASGKTSLVKQLLDQPFDPHENTTHGINIQGWEQEVGGRKIRINIWDFGGQEIQQATHQFFMSKHSLYVLVLDGRKDEHVEYWLRYIEAFGGDSPVLVVLNKQDENSLFDVNRPFLQEKYRSIRGFCCTSCKTGRGIAKFKEALLEELAKVEMIGMYLPKSWLTVKQHIEELHEPYISTEQYAIICKEAGITEWESRETLIDFLHDLGIVVYFKGFSLDNMYVLDPVWVTNAVYKIITAEKMADSNGVLQLEYLGNILLQSNEDKYSYPIHTHTYLLKLMKQFELCYSISEDVILIPQLLPVAEPQFSFDYSNSLCFALSYYDFLPPSTFPRFMVKTHKDIKDNLRWRTGVVLADTLSGSEAVVKTDHEVRRINIWVQGNAQREYLHYLRYLFADINSSFEKLRVRELVPMPDAQDITADYATLLGYAKNNIDKYIPTDATRVYSVHELLGLVQPKDKAELERVAEKATPQDTITWTEMINELIEPKWTVPVIGITINLKGLFDKLIARQKQKRQQARK